jgi:hypothetical protein
MPEGEYKVAPEDEILRRVKLPPPDRNENDLIKILPDGTRQITRLAFRPDPKRDKDGLSVNIISLAASADVLYNKETHLAVKIIAQKCFDIGLSISHNPLTDEETDPGYSHALINDLMDQKDKQAVLVEQCEILT